MPSRRMTIRDVARVAGVSTTTVSEALSGRGRTSPETRERVVRVAEEMGYVASAAARNLRLGRSGAVGLYVPDRAVGFEYYVQVARGAAEAALGHGLALTLVPAWNDRERLSQLHLDGLIVCDPALDDPVLQTLRTLPVPMVVCEPDPDTSARPVGVVGADHAAAMVELLEHLVGSGARSVAVLASGPETSFGEQVRGACAQVASATGVDVRLLDVRLAFAPEQVTRAVDEAMAARPDALVAVPDGAASVALSHLQASGVAIPDDLLFASYVDAASLQTSRPSVTAVDIDPRWTGGAAIDALVEVVIDGRPGPVRTAVPAQLRVRASTGREAPA